MKYILLVLLSFTFYINSYSQATVGSGGNLVATGNYPVVVSNDIKGGVKVVLDIAGRNAIPNNFRDTGMLVYVRSEAKTYQLKNGISNTNWEELSSGGSGAGLVIGDSSIYTTRGRTQKVIDSLAAITINKNKYATDSVQFSKNLGNSDMRLTENRLITGGGEVPKSLIIDSLESFNINSLGSLNLRIGNEVAGVSSLFSDADGFSLGRTTPAGSTNYNFRVNGIYTGSTLPFNEIFPIQSNIPLDTEISIKKSELFALTLDTTIGRIVRTPLVSGATWGGITGNISNQTDLLNLINLRKLNNDSSLLSGYTSRWRLNRFSDSIATKYRNDSIVIRNDMNLLSKVPSIRQNTNSIWEFRTLGGDVVDLNIRPALDSLRLSLPSLTWNNISNKPTVFPTNWTNSGDIRDSILNRKLISDTSLPTGYATRWRLNNSLDSLKNTIPAPTLQNVIATNGYTTEVPTFDGGIRFTTQLGTNILMKGIGFNSGTHTINVPARSGTLAMQDEIINPDWNTLSNKPTVFPTNWLNAG
ncbi:MAG: hypothetical protein EAZ64_09610, partial [Sphingobacteriales bacterium]